MHSSISFFILIEKIRVKLNLQIFAIIGNINDKM